MKTILLITSFILLTSCSLLPTTHDSNEQLLLSQLHTLVILAKKHCDHAQYNKHNDQLLHQALITNTYIKYTKKNNQLATSSEIVLDDINQFINQSTDQNYNSTYCQFKLGLISQKIELMLVGQSNKNR